MFELGDVGPQRGKAALDQRDRPFLQRRIDMGTFCR